MRDIDVRRALRREVLRHHEGEPDTLVIAELGLRHGITRVDIAVVNGSIHGYEIKSDADSLERLPSQIALYSAVLDKATLVVGERHAADAVTLLPPWWGVKIATEGPRGGTSLRHVERGGLNPAIDPIAVAELLWRSEVAGSLRRLDYPEKALRQARSYLYRELAGAVPIDELRAIVRQALKDRENWRHPRRPAPCGD